MTFQSLSHQELLQAIKKMPPEELDAFVEQVVSLRAKRHAPTLAPNETHLLQHINQALPETVWQRYRQLIKLRRQERLSEVEYEELLRLADSIEKDHLRRMELLADLAALRGQSLDQVMHDLGITPMPYA